MSKFSITYFSILCCWIFFSCQSSPTNEEADLKEHLGKLETELPRGGRIWSLDWSPDGQFLACGNATGLLRIYDAQTLKLVDILPGFKGTINSIDWSPDSKHIIASGPHEDPRIFIWDLQHKSSTIISDHQRQIRNVRWSPAGKYFASTSHDGTIRIWTPEGDFVQMFTGANGGCVGIDWLNENEIAGACWDNTIRTYTLNQTDSLLIENGKHRRKAVLSIDWHPNGQLLASGDYGNEEDPIHNVKIWTRDGQLKAVMTSHEMEVRSLAWSPNGNLLASGGETVRLWDSNGNLLHVFEENNSPVWSLDWNPAGTQIVSGHNDGKIRFWDTEGQLLRIIDGHSSEISSVAYNRDSSLVFVGFSQGLLCLFDLASNTSQSLVVHDRSVLNLTLSEDQKYLAASSNDGTCSILEISGRQLLKRASNFGRDIYARSIAWRSDNSALAFLHNEKDISIFSNDGILLGPQQLDRTDYQNIRWEGDAIIGDQLEHNSTLDATRIFLKRGQQTLELVPLHQDRFALIDTTQQQLIYGKTSDFIRLKKPNGFSPLTH